MPQHPGWNLGLAYETEAQNKEVTDNHGWEECKDTYDVLRKQPAYLFKL